MIQREAVFPFQATVTAIETFAWRPELQVEQTPAPQRIAPHSYALEASIAIEDDDLCISRLIVLHDDHPNPAWGGNYRFVSYTHSEADPEMVTDSLLTDVGWAWLTESLDSADALYHHASGTVTCQSSRSYGELADEPDRAEIEIRASWTATITRPEDVSAHLQAWQTLACTSSGVPPLPDDIIPISTRIERA